MGRFPADPDRARVDNVLPREAAPQASQFLTRFLNSSNNEIAFSKILNFNTKQVYSKKPFKNYIKKFKMDITLFKIFSFFNLV